ncbi:MAG: MBL fold metallo-hydrolase [Lachnospiraceae bacterium]|nr:MBL fold metallo-hydrolase [Lachnospiraceae bacterium]
MEIQYLGTAAAEGWPALFCDCGICRRARQVRGKELRTRTQSIIDGQILVDFPPDTYAHALNYSLQLGQIQHLLITHSHMDHFFPVELIHRHEHFGHNAKGILHVYGNEAVEKAFYDAVLIDRFKVHPLDDHVKFIRLEPFADFIADGYHIIPVPADHDKRETCFIYIIEKDGKCLLYGHDTGLNLTQEAWNCIFSHKYDLISMDATMGRKQIGGYHMGLPDDVEFARLLEEKGCIDEHTVRVINHFSHNGEMTHEELDQFAREHGMIASYDGMKVNF